MEREGAIQDGPFVGSTHYVLNKSNTKTLEVGISPVDLLPSVRIVSARNAVAFGLVEWNEFLQHRNPIMDYFENQTAADTVYKFTNYNIHLEEYKKVKVLRIIGPYSEIFLGYETTKNLFQITHIVDCKLEYLMRQDFQCFYTSVLNKVKKLRSQEIEKEIELYLNLSPLNANKICMLEMILLNKNKIVYDLEMCNKY
ncbi:TPA_asm: MOSUB [Bos-associated insect adintovirus]|uniref:MOSUB n=1 Tax=Bos-associated insect adintovirus TaxID=2597806 RepID=A0A5H3CT48_9VIRU|nr:TPA_asm: MOSUB [Bos-associated insect adintovirus]